MNTLPSTRVFIVGLCVAALAAGGAYWVATNPARVAAAQNVLVVEEPSLAFGEVWEVKGFVWKVPIFNRSGEDVTIQGFEASCACVDVKPRSLVIPAGQTAEVRLTVDLTKRSTEADRSTAARAFEVMLSPRWQGEGSHRTIWVLRGRVRTALDLSPQTLRLGELTRGQPFRSQKATVSPRTPLEDLEAGCDSSLARVQVKRLKGSEGKFELEVSPERMAPAGPLRFDVKIRPVARGGKRLPTIALPVEGFVREDIQAAPEAVAFGVVPVGQTVAETLFLRSAGNRDFKVEKVGVSSEGAKVEPTERGTSAPGRAFRVTQRVSRSGHQAGTITFTVRQAMGQTLRIVVPVSYHGIQKTDG